MRRMHAVVVVLAVGAVAAGCGEAGSGQSPAPGASPSASPSTTSPRVDASEHGLAVSEHGLMSEHGLTVSEHGLTVSLPTGWQAAAASLTPHLVDPREELAIATFPLRYRATECAHVPGSALEDLGPQDAFVTLQERGADPGSAWAGFPPRPARFGPDLGGPSEAGACVPSAHFTDHWFTFSDGARHFHVLVAFGPQAPAAVQQQAWTILDRLRVDQTVLPDWRSSG